MLFAKIIFGLAVEGPFDYLVPPELKNMIKPGSRVIVSFGCSKKTGYVVSISPKSNIKNLKSVIECLDEAPVIDAVMLQTAKLIAQYYCCCQGEALEAMLPQALRLRKKTALHASYKPANIHNEQRISIVHAPEKEARWNFYIEKITTELGKGGKIIILLPDNEALNTAEKLLRINFNNRLTVLIKSRADELNTWLKIKQGQFDIVLGLRSAIFAPVNNLSLIIIEEEQSYGYKQDQSPHYHAREIGILRAQVENATVILGSSCPSLETMELKNSTNAEYVYLPRKKTYPQIKVIDTKRLPAFSFKKDIILSHYLEDSIAQSLANKERVLLFLNRLGFATQASCVSCGATLKCPRCSINLVFHYKESTLNCHYCNFKMPLPKLCPQCNAGYLHYRGAGKEKIESELSRIFPQAKIQELGSPGTENSDTDIYISSQAMIKQTQLNFSLTGCLSIDNSLNHPDFRSQEKAFQLLNSLASLTEKIMIIQTGITNSHIFTSLASNDPEIFYKEELKQRKELKLPPFKHLALLKLRGLKAEKVENTAKALFAKISQDNSASVQAVSVNAAELPKLRNNFYWQILIRGTAPQKITRFIKTGIHNFPHSGIIVTVDIDPI